MTELHFARSCSKPAKCLPKKIVWTDLALTGTEISFELRKLSDSFCGSWHILR